ncbi:MAG: UDP-N-acetylglucosamine 2-epimerase [Gammaproteobacteria bacterium]
MRTDQISEYFSITEASARDNLRREGISEEKVYFVGNVMIDSLLGHREWASLRPVLKTLGLRPCQYALVTLHRPANVDDPGVLAKLIEALCTLSERLPVLFPVHPRTRQKLSASGLDAQIARYGGFQLISPLDYLDFLECMDNARLVITDSGGIQEETTVLGVPCITARDNTERPVTVSQGTNVVVGRDPERILQAAFAVLQGEGKEGRCPELWDGRAAARIVEILWEREGLGCA